MKKIHLLILVLLVTLIPGAAIDQGEAASRISKAPGKIGMNREFVYGLFLFDGVKYGATFCPEAIDTVYLLAGVNNVLTAHKTDVYFWPITQEYMADWEGFHSMPVGRLEILRGNCLVKTIRFTKFALYYPGGTQTYPAGLVVGDEAVHAIREYQLKLTRYNQELSDYYQKYMVAQKTLLSELKEPDAPRESFSDLSDGFIVNLPSGEYRIRLRDVSGKIMMGSERKLVAFSSLKYGTGYEVVQEEKWTYPLKSNDIGDNIFVLSRRKIFLKPFRSSLYNSYSYLKLSQLASPVSGRGMENKKDWVPLTPLEGRGLKIQILRNGKVIKEIKEKPYYVKQNPGQALGYDIVEFDPNKEPEGGPTFAGYKIALPQRNGKFSLRLVDSKGKEVPGSLRNLIVSNPKPGILHGISLFPLCIWVVILGIRRIQITLKTPQETDQLK